MGTNIKFLTDPTLGRLTKWLRIFGFNTLNFSYPFSEKQFLEKARSQNRLILTRSNKIVRMLKEEDYFFIGQNHIEEQIKALISKGIISKPDSLFKRCTECNELLKDISREFIHGKVPDYVRETRENFKQCPHCKKIFWPGTHYEKMKKQVEKMFGEKI